MKAQRRNAPRRPTKSNVNLSVHLGKDFTDLPGPRYRRQGAGSGEEFRDRFLIPALKRAVKEGKKATITMAGTQFGCPVGFLEEAFGGLVRRHGLGPVRRHMTITGDASVQASEIESLMEDADMD